MTVSDAVPACLAAGRVPPTMKLIRTAAVAGIAKKLYGESRKPENQRRIKQAVESVRSRRAGRHSR